MIIALLLFWEIMVYALTIPVYLLPPPSLIIITLYHDAWLFWNALLVTGQSLLLALTITSILAPLLACLFHMNKRMARVFAPLIVVMQVTPLVAVIPLLLIWFNANTAVIVSGVLIAIIPLFLNIKAGFDDENHELSSLFTLYKASPWQRFWLLNRPFGQIRFYETLPLTGSLALVGTIVGEFMAGTGGGLAARLIESQYRLNTPRLFACLAVIAAMGLALNYITHRLFRRQP